MFKNSRINTLTLGYIICLLDRDAALHSTALFVLQSEDPCGEKSWQFLCLFIGCKRSVHIKLIYITQVVSLILRRLVVRSWKLMLPRKLVVSGGYPRFFSCHITFRQKIPAQCWYPINLLNNRKLDQVYNGLRVRVTFARRIFAVVMTIICVLS